MYVICTGNKCVEISCLAGCCGPPHGRTLLGQVTVTNTSRELNWVQVTQVVAKRLYCNSISYINTWTHRRFRRSGACAFILAQGTQVRKQKKKGASSSCIIKHYCFSYQTPRACRREKIAFQSQTSRCSSRRHGYQTMYHKIGGQDRLADSTHFS